MKAKQLPGDVEEWLNSQTIVIWVNSLAANAHRPARGGDDEERKLERSSSTKTVRLLTWIKLVPLFRMQAPGPG